MTNERTEYRGDFMTERAWRIKSVATETESSHPASSIQVNTILGNYTYRIIR